MIFFTAASHAESQDACDSVLLQVEKNNSTLAALRQKAEAEKTGNRTGIFLPGPEAEFNYLWGSPEAIGNRTDISVRQSFDFPSAYIYRSKISDLRNEQTELEYLKQKSSIFLQVRLICADLVYLNSMRSVISAHYEKLTRIADQYAIKYNAGEIGILELNKAKLNLVTVGKDLENNSTEIAYSLNELARYNGGIPVQYADT